MEPVEPRMEIGFICLRVIFYRGSGDNANFGFRERVVEEVTVKSKDLTQSAQRGGGEHRGTNGARFTAETQRKTGEILRYAQDDVASRLTRRIIGGGLAIGRGSRLRGRPGLG